MRDSLGRPLHDLRISVTDRCNFRCVYCMPKEVFGGDYPFLERAELLTFEEIARVTRIAAGLGVEKVRLTGGEPLLRRDLEKLVAQLAGIEAIRDLTLTTNGSLLTPAKARSLAGAGLNRITISLDSLDDHTFRDLTDSDLPVQKVLDAVESAVMAGLTPVKIDMVIIRGRNEHSVVDVARRFRGTGCIVRFIEYMDVGNTNGWRLADVVSAAEIQAAISAHWPIERIPPNYAGEVAERWRYLDGKGEIGIITSVTQPFCGACTRLRLSAAGKIYTCLFAGEGRDVRALLRSEASDADIRAFMGATWKARADRYSEIRSEATEGLRKVEMSHIGG